MGCRVVTPELLYAPKAESMEYWMVFLVYPVVQGLGWGAVAFVWNKFLSVFLGCDSNPRNQRKLQWPVQSGHIAHASGSGHREKKAPGVLTASHATKTTPAVQSDIPS